MSNEQSFLHCYRSSRLWIPNRCPGLARRLAALTCWGILCTLALGLHAYGQTVQSSLRKGQSLTLLPSGQILLAGGYDSNGLPSADLMAADVSGKVTPLASKMLYARGGHTATVLPDGRVLIFGGYGMDGKLVTAGELLDLSSGTTTAITEFRLLPRAFHTATVLTDGTLVVVGGVGIGGELTHDVQVWDYRTGKTLAYNAGLSVPRQQHSATLLPNGDVQISSGLDQFGKPTQVTEEYDSIAHKISINSSESPTSGPTVQESVPADGATGVRITDILAVRFGGQMSVLSLNSTNVTLQDTNGNSAPATITGAEAGRLLFVVPSAPLQFGTTYLLTLTNLTDSNGRQLPTKTIQFTTQADPQDSSDEEWVPGSGDFNGQWHSHTGQSEWQTLPPLQAKAGITALAGQVLRLNGRPLQHVLLQFDGQNAYSDRTGRFLISSIRAGHHVLVIDGRAANRSGVVYGLFEVGVDVLPGRTNALKYTIWMTKLDTQHAVNIPSPTIAPDTVITSPRLPGLELHLPQNTVIVDHDGHPVHQLTITPIPLDKPPFPLPAGVQVPIYFTIQPGGAYIDVRNYSSTGIKGARLIYPNPYHSASGTEFNFWNYDAVAKGWYVYGHGKVSKDGQSVVPDPGVVVYELTGAMVGDAGGPFPFPPVFKSPKDGEPVDLSTGNYSYTETDLGIFDTQSIVLTRTYRTNDSVSRAFGIGTTMNYDFYMTGDQHPYTYQEMIQPDGSRTRFDAISPGINFTNVVYRHSSDQDDFSGAILEANAPTCGLWAARLKNGSSVEFPDSDTNPNYRAATPCAITDRNGNRLTFQRNSNGDLLEVDSQNGKFIKFVYDASDRVIQAIDSLGRNVTYSYDATGRLATVTDAAGNQRSYTYDNNNNLLTIMDERGIVVLSNQYDSAGRVSQQTLANGGTYLFAWTPTQNTSETYGINDPTGASAGGVLSFQSCTACSEGYTPLISQVDVTDPRGYIHRVSFDSMGRKATEMFAVGQPEQQVHSYTYNADNSVQSYTSPAGHRTTYAYDANLNVIQVNQLAETSAPITTAAAYDQQFGQVISTTDAVGNVTRFTLDAVGNTTQITDQQGDTATITYNSDGTRSSYADQQGSSLQFGYTGGILSSSTDALGNRFIPFFDPGGRLLAVSDASGASMQYSYDVFNHVTAETNAATGTTTHFAYDAAGNLTSVTDGQHHTTTYTFNNLGRISTRTDPLQRQESYTYDLGGNLSTTTDRKGQVTSYVSDGLGRISSVAFGVQSGGNGSTAQSTISYIYDQDNRAVAIADSTSGTITRTYDALGDLTNETTPQGSVIYTYDNLGRRLTMQVSGQPQVVYTWDNANRVTHTTQGSSSVAIAYDNANRRTSLTLPNGIVASYSYDSNSRLIGISYSSASNSIGDLTYSYNSVGLLTGIGGSLSSMSVPAPVGSATYDAANELTSWNGVAISYDPNGNTVNDGTHTYSWDARGHLVAIDLGSTATFTYDGVGRRVGRTALGGIAVGYLYDLDNVVQELTGGSPSVNLLTGDVDEYFSTTDSSGTASFLTDMLGSAVALTDGSAAIQTRYQYDPFGQTTISGASTTNVFGFTGREMDVAGLYFYRARYYSPTKGRFLSEDPLEFGGGVNLYAYALNSPTTGVDPTGLQTKVFPQSFVGPLKAGDVRGYIADLSNSHLKKLIHQDPSEKPRFWGESHQCVAFTKKWANLPCTDCWRAGPKVLGNDIPPGTAIATFKGDRFPSEEGYNSAIYVGTGVWKSIDILDQFPEDSNGNPHPAQLRPLPYHGSGWPDNRSNSADAYSVITVPPGTKSSKCECGQ